MTNTNKASIPPLPDFQITPDYKTSLQRFFNGDTIDHALSELDVLRETLITESYGELERNEKWLMIDFLRRIGNLIGTAHSIYSKHS